MAVIKDKKTRLCICGRSSEERLFTAKERVLRWMGTTVVLGAVILTVIDPLVFIGMRDGKSIVVVVIVLYAIVGVTYKSIRHAHQGHTLKCSLRRGYLEVV